MSLAPPPGSLNATLGGRQREDRHRDVTTPAPALAPDPAPPARRFDRR